jgi:hypothetical protein
VRDCAAAEMARIPSTTVTARGESNRLQHIRNSPFRKTSVYCSGEAIGGEAPLYASVWLG